MPEDERDPDGLGAVYAARFDGDLPGEARAWLHVAARRLSAIDEIHRDLLGRDDLAGAGAPHLQVVRAALVLISQQTAEHHGFVQQALAGKMFEGRAFAADVMIWLARMEQELVRRHAGHAGAATDLRTQLLLCSTLEQSVRRSQLQLERLTGASPDLAVKVMEKGVHEQVCREMAAWVAGTAPDPTVPARVYAERLRRLLFVVG